MPTTPTRRSAQRFARRTARPLLIVALALAFSLTAFIGQAKPPPPTIDGPPPPTHDTRKPKPAPLDDRPQPPDVLGFAEAYANANEPPVLVIVGRDTRTYDQLGATATGLRSDASDRVIGGQLNLIDAEANALKLAGDIEELLLATPDMDLIDVSALTEADRREVKLLEMQGELDAVDLLATKVNAELVLLVRLIDTAVVQDKGARYRVVVEALDVPRGRKIGGFTFDWMLGTDSRTIKRYATAITRKFMDQFTRAKSFATPDGAPRKYTVKFIGLDSIEQMRVARDAFRGVRGVTRVRTRGMSAAQGTSVGTLDVSFAGDPLNLVFDAKQTIGEELGMAPQASDMQSGTITFKAGQPAYRIELQGVPEGVDPDAVREQLEAIKGLSGVTDRGLILVRTTGDRIAAWSAEYGGNPIVLAQQATDRVGAMVDRPIASDVQYDPRTGASVIVLSVEPPLPLEDE